MTYRKLVLTLASFVLALSGTAIAQDDDDHGLINVRMTTVKPGKAPEFQELLGQLAESRKAAGYSGMDVWQVIRGPVGAFYSVSYADDYADFGNAFDSGMSDGDWQRWIGRITDVIDHSRVTILRTHGELAIAPPEESAPVMVLLRFTELDPGEAGDHHEWLANSLVPALKEGNTRGWNVSDVRFGDNVNTWVSASRIDSWEQLDGPNPLSHMSDRARNNMLEDYFERAESVRVELVRYLPELSY
jgi:hypothetical protein